MPKLDDDGDEVLDPNDYLDDDIDEDIMKVLGKFAFQELIPNFAKLSYE